LDPLAFRIANLDDERLGDCLEAAARRAGWPAGAGDHHDPGKPSPGRRGLGIAGSVEKGARVATCAEVEVGGDGSVRLVRIVTAFDCGSIVDPDGLASQVEGAAVMAIGPALFERVRFDDRGISNASLGAYRVPR